MADIKLTTDGIVIPLTKALGKKLLGGNSNAGVEFILPRALDVLDALKSDTPFPNRVIQLSEISAKATAGSEGVQFASGGGTASFKASAGVSSGLAVYPEPKSLLKDIGLGDDISPGLQLTADAKSNYLLMRWGYEVGGSAKAGVVFGGPASAAATAGGKSEGTFAIVRQLPKTTGALTAINETVQGWLLPLQIASVDDLEPGTWIIAEVDSSVSVGIEAQYGFDFTWVKETEALGLSGDIGLRLCLGAKAAFGYQAGGRFAVVVSRDSVSKTDKKIRIRLFKQRQNGWNFAMDAQVGAQANTSNFFPEDFDDFIRAVFGTHGAQIMKDIELIEQWSDPNAPLPGMLASLGSDYFKKFLKDTTGVDPETAFNDAKGKLLGFVEKWNNLDHAVASLLWKQAEKKANLTKIRAFNNKLMDTKPEKARAFLRKEIEKVDFFSTLGGQFLLAMLPEENLLSALTDSEVLKKIQAAATKASHILDGGLLTDTLVKLQDNINKRLNLDQITQKAEETDFATLDNWLKLKLERFIDGTLSQPLLLEIRNTIHTITAKRQEFYDLALKALNRQYSYGFNVAYQKNTTSSALVDLTIDTAKAEAGAFIKLALLGQFDKILTKPTPGVTLNEGSLTHGVRIQSAVSINLPFFKGSSTHLNDCLVKANALDEQDGRVFVYDLKATDVVTNDREQISALSIDGHFRAKSNVLRVHDQNPLAYAYSFQQFRPAMKVADLQLQLKPYVETYLPNLFQDGSLDTWITTIEQQAERLAPNGAGILGDTLLYMEQNLPAQAASAWMNAPTDPNAAAYGKMSRRIQRQLKQLIPFYYFQNLKNYEDIRLAPALLAYSATPNMIGFQEKGGKWFEAETGVYWNWKDKKMQRLILNWPRTNNNLLAKLTEVHALLKATPGMEKLADKFYQPVPARKPGEPCPFLANVLDEFESGKTAMHFESLFFVEATIIGQAHKAGLAMAAFLQKSGTEPSRAVKLLTDFGTNLTMAFNKNFTSVFGDAALRPLSTVLFLEAAQAFLPENAQTDPSVLLNLTVLKQGARFKPDQRTRPGSIPPADVLVSKQVVDMGA
ncbi:MAG: hypothetical protein ABMA02_12520 [Saprospiraceae bacterium]